MKKSIGEIVEREGMLRACISASATPSLKEAVCHIVQEWIECGGCSLDETPPVHEDGATVFARWTIFLNGEEIVAVPEWGNYGRFIGFPTPKVGEQIVGKLEEQVSLFLEQKELVWIEVAIEAIGDPASPAYLVPRLGFESEVSEWRANMSALFGS